MLQKKKIMTVFGTRPEAIKICPLVNEMKKREGLDVVVCVTAQHRQMLDQVLKTFDVVPDYDLNIMKERQTLFDITTNILNAIKDVLEKENPDVVLVHGDTSTTFVTALACFYLQIPVGHVEAGLRTYNIYSPYPEEFNRQAVGVVSKYNFAPTQLAADHLIAEGKNPDSIYITGNTVIDAMQHTVKEDYSHPELEWVGESKLIFITAHRRENLGEPIIQQNFKLDVFSGSLFLFCGKRCDRIKALLWEEDGFVLLYKRLENGKYKWPRDSDEARQITQQEFRWLMEGLSIEQKTAIKPARTGAVC